MCILLFFVLKIPWKQVNQDYESLNSSPPGNQGLWKNQFEQSSNWKSSNLESLEGGQKADINWLGQKAEFQKGYQGRQKLGGGHKAELKFGH